MKTNNPLYTVLFLLTALSAMGQDLESFMEHARTHHPGLQATYQLFQAEMEKVNQVGILPDPTLAAGVFIRPVETRVGPQIIKLSLSQRLPWFGTLKAEKEVMRQRTLVSYEAYNLKWRELEYSIAKSWYELNHVNQLIRYHQELLTLNESLHDLSLTKFEAGTASLASVLRIQMVIDELKIKIEGLEDLLETKKSSFNLLINRSREETITLPDTITSQYIQILPHDSLAGHPRLRQLSLQQEALEKETDLIRYMGKPGIGIGLDYVMTGERTDMVVADNGKDVLMPMVSFTLPIFRKKYHAMREEVNYRIESNNSRQEEEMINLQKDYDLAEWQYFESVRNVALYGELVVKSTKVADLLITEFSVSGEYLNDVLDVQEDILNYKIKQLNALTDRYVAAAKIKSLTGN